MSSQNFQRLGWYADHSFYLLDRIRSCINEYKYAKGSSANIIAKWRATQQKPPLLFKGMLSICTNLVSFGQ